MKALLHIALLCWFAFAPSVCAQVVNVIDPDFAPSLNSLATVVTQPDGKILVGGSFTTVNGEPRDSIARLHPDGSLDFSFESPGFTPSSDFTRIDSILVAPDGKIYILGTFKAVSGVPRFMVARLNSDGSLDTTFAPEIDPPIDDGSFTYTVAFGMVLQPDGKLIVSGVFETVGGFPSKNLARMNSDGTRDTTFTPPILVKRHPHIALLSDGKILLFGFLLTTVDGLPRTIARLNPDGSLDQGYDPAIESKSVHTVQELPDGRLALFGRFTEVNGIPRPGAAILNLDGSLDPAYAGGTSLQFASALHIMQADGSVIISGQIDGESKAIRRKIDGSIDPTYHLIGQGGGYSLREDGRLLQAGSTWRLPQYAQSIQRGLALIHNDPSTSIITAVDAGRIRWLRGGTAPFTNQVRFEYSADGETNWTPLGKGTWQGNGEWELAGLSLPSAGFIRGIARMESRFGARRFEGFTSRVASYDFANPMQRVEDAAANPVADGDGIDFGGHEIGRDQTLDFTIRNLGHPSLNGLQITITGPDAAMFHLDTAPSPSVPGPGGSTMFRIRFTPISPGAKSATLQWTSNDPAQPTFALNLTGIGVGIGGVDPNFNPEIRILSGLGEGVSSAPGVVRTAAQAPDGKLLVGGFFEEVQKLARNSLTQLHPDSSVDYGFNVQTSGTVRAVAVQYDGKILVAGTFGALNGIPRDGIGRYHPDGTVDQDFNPGISGITHLLVQPDGKILVAGQNGDLQRLNPDGTTDPTFSPSITTGSNLVLALQRNGKILISQYLAPNSLVQRLHPDGSLDTGFNASIPDVVINSMVLQPDGKILYAGKGLYPNGFSPSVLGRLHPDGTQDSSLAVTSTSNSVIYSIALLADGRILVGGAFTELAGPAQNIALLFPDGTRDNSFAGTADEFVFAVLTQANGQLLYGGQFSNSLVRILQSGATSEVVVPATDRVEWRRGGPAGEIAGVTFDLSTDGGASWTLLGEGEPIPGGWTLTSLSLPQQGIVRARGRAHVSGFVSTSSSLFEETATYTLQTSLQAWRTLQGLAADGSQDRATPANDGVANLLKYAFNMAPNAGDLVVPNVGILSENGTAGLPSITRDAQGRLVIQFIRRQTTTNPGISYTVETGEDLTALQPLALTGALIDPIDTTWERVTVTDPVITPKRFGRLRIEK